MSEIKQDDQSSQKLAVYERMAIQTNIDAETIAVIHRSVAKNTTPSELAYFLNVAKGVDLNPFLKEIWCYKDNKGNLLVFTGRDGFMKLGKRDSRYNGFNSHEVCENDTFEMIITSDGQAPKVIHGIKPSASGRGRVIGAYCVCFLKDGAPYSEWVDFSRYNKGFNTWNTHPEEMIKKVAESHAFKKCYGITGIQAAEDYDVIDGVATPVGREKKLLNQ